MLTVASYNIRKSVGLDWKREPNRVLDVIREIDADVVALQEVDRRFGSRASSLSADDIIANTPYFPLRFGIRPQSLGWHGNTILVRKGGKVIFEKRIDLPALEPRGAVLADIDFGGETMRIVGVHLGLVGLWRKKQARAVLDAIEALEERRPTVIMGDLNQWTVEGGCLSHFAEHHHVIVPGPSFHSSRPVVAFDRIITSRDISVHDTGVHRSARAERASDHLPVWARLSVQRA
jgi:endonuclease/exonuclease/phosphatase family metal-dependent hydrolase